MYGSRSPESGDDTALSSEPALSSVCVRVWLNMADDYIWNDLEMYVLNKARSKTAKRSGMLQMNGSNSINPEVLLN